MTDHQRIKKPRVIDVVRANNPHVELALKSLNDTSTLREYLCTAQRLDIAAAHVAIEGGVICQYWHLLDRIKQDQKALEEFEESIGEKYDLAALRDGELVPARRIVN
ncbi:hypothetical protein LCM08_26525 [Salipiger pacificus]|nr:hypothetical protein [Alloyangia pacifica]